jgi:hypothetical protein
MLRVILLAVIAALAFAVPAGALENENLLVTMPKGYKVGFHNKTARELMSEMVPESETVENWTEMVTVQIFFNLRDVSPSQYRARVQKLWADACPGSTFTKVKEGIENLYPTQTWTQKCPVNKQTGKAGTDLVQGRAGPRQFLPGAEGLQVRADSRANGGVGEFSGQCESM